MASGQESSRYPGDRHEAWKRQGITVVPPAPHGKLHTGCQDAQQHLLCLKLLSIHELRQGLSLLACEGCAAGS